MVLLQEDRLSVLFLGIILEFVILDFPPIGGIPVPNGCVGVGICCYLVDKTGDGFFILLRGYICCGLLLCREDYKR